MLMLWNMILILTEPVSIKIPLTQKDDGTLNYLTVTNSTGKAMKVTFLDTTPSTAYKKGDIWVKVIIVISG